MSLTKESMQKKPVVLIGFVTLSLLAHALLFLFQVNPPSSLAQASLGSNRLSISLVSADTKATSNAETPARPTVKDPLQKTPQKMVAKKPVQTMFTADNSTTTSIIKTKPQTTPNAMQRNFLLGEIKHRLSRYLSYPVRARRRGWQGEVMVGFHVDKQGFLRNVHLTQTSGYSLLDNAALNAIGKVKNIPLSSWFKNNHEDTFYPTALQLPVSYRLTNS